MKSMYILLGFLVAGCSGIGVISSYNPDVKIAQAYQMLADDRAVMAETLIAQALKKYKEQGNSLGMAESHYAFGNLYSSRSYHVTWADAYKEHDRYDPTYMNAIEHFAKAKEFFEQADSEVGVIKSLDAMGIAYSYRQEKDKSCAYFQDALLRYEAGKKDNEIRNEPVILSSDYRRIQLSMKDLILQHLAVDRCDTGYQLSDRSGDNQMK